jgi:hypothetical protein
MSIFADTLQFFHYVMMLDIFVGLDAGFIMESNSNTWWSLVVNKKWSIE